jgi:hypothetical protein
LVRPLAVELKGLSARATKLVLAAFPASSGKACKDISLQNAASLDPPFRSEWDRASAMERELMLPPIGEDGAAVYAYSVDMNGTTIQFVCYDVTFEGIGDLEYGILTLILSKRVSM